MKNYDPINIAIIDDDRLFVQLLQTFLESTDEIVVLQTAQSGTAFLREIHPELDLILLDLRMDDGNGLNVLSELQKASSPFKTIVLSTFYRPTFLGQMLKLGANAFLPKEIDQDELIEVIREVHSKGHFFNSEQIEVMRQQLSHKTPKFHLPQKDGITEREIEVLRLLAQQYTTKEIAEALFLSTKTIESHKSNLLLKTGAKNSAGLIIYAIQNGLIDPNEFVLV